jgi:hypothetical protein
MRDLACIADCLCCGTLFLTGVGVVDLAKFPRGKGKRALEEMMWQTRYSGRAGYAHSDAPRARAAARRQRAWPP